MTDTIIETRNSGRVPQEPGRFCIAAVLMSVVLLLHVATGCAAMRTSGIVRTSDIGGERRMDVRRQLRERTSLRFSQADFLKPKNAGASDRLNELAPLIVQERPVIVQERPGDRGGCIDRIGSVVIDEEGRYTVAPSPPTVYSDQTWTEIGGVLHEQVVYVWFYAGDGPSLDAAILAQGIRMTMGRDGYPCIWEVLSVGAGDQVRPIYVSQSLEDAAEAYFRALADGGANHCDTSRAVAGDTCIVRILSDGPVPMGPFAYVQSCSRAISTLLCRCMPSQVDAFTTTGYYELRPVSELRPLDARWFEQLGYRENQREILQILEGRVGADLSKSLRLPPGF